MTTGSAPARDTTRRLSPVALTCLVAVAGALVTLAVSVLPTVRFAYRNPSLHLVVETADGAVALLAALLVYGRVRQRPVLSDLLLAQALALLGLASLAFAVLPTALTGERAGTFATWVPVVVRLLGALLLAAAAVVPPGRVSRRLAWRDAGGTAGVVTGVAVAVWLLGPRLPEALDPALSPEASGRPLVVGHPAVVTAQAMSVVCFAVAAVAFTRRAERTGDEMLRWLGAAAGLGTFARVSYFLFPSMYSEWIYTGDVLRAGFYLLVLVGAVREIERYWAAQTQAAVFEDRRRVARELHDGVVQELGYIRLQAQRLVGGHDRGAVQRILSASDRGLDEARHAVDALSRPADEPVASAVERAAREVTGRYGVGLTLRLEGDVSVGMPAREALVRILREALSNAARHSRADHVTVTLGSVDGDSALTVRDDGVGFVPESLGTTSPGFGLTTMRDRADGMGARFRLASAPGEGTVVEVVW